MVCLLQTCCAARSRPTGGRPRPQAGFAFARFPLSQSIFGTARSGQGRAVCARRSEPLTARTVLEHGAEGKAGRGSQGVSPWRGSGAAPRAPYRARFLRAASSNPAAAFQSASASTKFGKSSNTQLFFRGQDREVPLSPKLLDQLRSYYRSLKCKTGWIFPSLQARRSDQPITAKAVWHACREATRRAASPSPSTRTRSATASPLICWTAAPNFPPSRFCWDTLTCATP